MRVSEEAAWHFIDLYTPLLYWAGRERGVLPDNMTFAQFGKTNHALKAKCRDAIYTPRSLLAVYLAAHPDLPAEDRATITAWERYVKGTFVILRYLKKYAIFLGTDEPPRAYAVRALTTSFDEMIPPYALPHMCETVLLPYDDGIVCDGLIASQNLVIGSNMRRNMNADYQQMKRAGQLVKTL